MSVTMRFGHLADYAAIEQSGKIILGGIFDVVHVPTPDATIVPALFFLAARLECSLADGIEHDVSVRVSDGEEEQIGNEITIGRISFQASGPGRPLTFQLIARSAGVQVEGVGDYHFSVVVDGRPIGEIPFFVQLAPFRG